MSLNKKVLAVAIVGGLFAGSAHAAVNISAPTPVPVRIASEVNFASGSLAVANVANALTLQSNTNYAFSAGEVRYARIECSSNLVFPATVPTPTVAGSNTGVGAVNGLGTNAIHFSITAPAGGHPTTAQIAVAGGRTFTSRDNVTCAYALYDQPSQAAAGGTDGRIAFQQGAYATFASSYLYDLTPRTATASVEANPVFTAFLAPTGSLNSAGTASLGDIEFGTRADIGTGTQPIDADGEAIELADILAAGTAHVITGDFSAAANANGTFTGATNRVFVSNNNNCSTVDIAATALTATTATFVTDAAPVDATLCYTPRAGVAIPASEYTIALSPVSNSGYTAGPLGPLTVGTIVRDGTELQAPIAQIPTGWLSRLVLTNTGTVPRPYSINVLTEEGVTVSTGTLTGTVPANGTRVIEDVRQVFTGNNRATLVVNVAGPNNTIQGLYQIVNPESGSISNHVLVRPGTN